MKNSKFCLPENCGGITLKFSVSLSVFTGCKFSNAVEVEVALTVLAANARSVQAVVPGGRERHQNRDWCVDE